MFRSKKLDYYELDEKFKSSTELKYYFIVKFKYHCIIFIPPILFIIILYLWS
jgi:hypothetical protein